MKESKEVSLSPELVSNLIRSRRSVFVNQFVPGKKIPDNIIYEILENANWAPTHKKTEPWRFMVFTGPGLQKLATFQSDMYKKNAGGKFKEDKFRKLATTPLDCSHVISISMKRSLEANIPEVEEIAAVACAVQNIYLSVTAYGLGGYWTTGGVTYMKEAKPFFHLEEDDRLMGFFYLGYVQIPPVRSTRGPIEEKTVWVSE
ncbi:MAG: nitroreductase [Chitinophagales bacterium]